MVSVFDIFKIGIGPSSSHTVGPMKAGKQFVDDLIAHQQLQDTTRVVVDVYGSLSLTGKGHHTDIAIIMGLAGNLPHDVDIDSIPGFIRDVEQRGRLPLANGHHEVDFPLHGGMNFHSDNLPLHENGMRIRAFAGERLLHSKTYYSIGGGFIVDEEHFGQSAEGATPVPYPFKSAHDLQQHCKETGLSLSGLVMQNELALRSKADIDAHFADVWQVMSAGIERGINTEGLLPGPMKVPRRAAALRRILVTGDKNNIDPMNVVDWINMFALAVNEENAAGGRVVTAPTNGACGIIPAVLAYYDKFIRPVNANSLHPLFPGVRRDWRIVQNERLDLRCRSGLSGGSGRSLFDGGGRVDRAAGRQPGAGVHRGGDRHGAPFGADLRSARRPGSGALHRTQCHFRRQGGQRRAHGDAPHQRTASLSG